MANLRGFKLARRVRTLCRRVVRRRIHHFSAGCSALSPSAAISGIRSWGRRLKTRAKAAICSAASRPGRGLLPGSGPGRGYVPIGGEEKPEAVPKGHLAVYVGQEDGDFRRVLVPVMYFNHPLFGELLREAEEQYGFHHPGGITIPCRISEFESVQTRIAAVHGCRRKALDRGP